MRPDVAKRVKRVLSRPLEPTKWLVEGFLVQGHYTMITGLYSRMKSSLSLWLARQSLRSSLIDEVFYVDLENSDKIVRARFDWIGVNEADDAKITYLNDSPDLADEDRPIWDFSPAYMALTAEHKNCLFVFDSLSCFTSGLDENSAQMMVKVRKFARHFTREGNTFLIIHQDPKEYQGQSNVSRGSTEIPAGTDIVIQISEFYAGDNPVMRLRTAKTRFEHNFDNYWLFNSIDKDFERVDSRLDGKLLNQLLMIDKVIASNDGCTINDITSKLKQKVGRDRVRELIREHHDRWHVEKAERGKQILRALL